MIENQPPNPVFMFAQTLFHGRHINKNGLLIVALKSSTGAMLCLLRSLGSSPFSLNFTSILTYQKFTLTKNSRSQHFELDLHFVCDDI